MTNWIPQIPVYNAVLIELGLVRDLHNNTYRSNLGFVRELWEGLSLLGSFLAICGILFFLYTIDRAQIYKKLCEILKQFLLNHFLKRDVNTCMLNSDL